MGHEIIAIDEASFQLLTTYKKICFPRGETPRGAFFWSNKKLITFGALTSDHKFFYDFYDSQNSLTFKHFLRGVFEKLDKKKKYVLILDNAGFHKTQCIKSLFEEYSGQINVDPIETCWKVTKNRVTCAQKTLFSCASYATVCFEYCARHYITRKLLFSVLKIIFSCIGT